MDRAGPSRPGGTDRIAGPKLCPLAGLALGNQGPGRVATPRAKSWVSKTPYTVGRASPESEVELVSRVASNRGPDEGSPDGGLLDYESAAAYLCTTPRYVRELWARRRLAAIKVGRSVRFHKSDLDAYIAANRVGSVR